MWGSAPPVSAPSEAKHSHTAAGSSLQAKGGRGWKRFDSRAATERKQCGLGKPETFNFLGFTLICGKSRRGSFLIHRKTRRDRMKAKLKEIKGELRRRMHRPIPEQGKWLKQVTTGFFAYHAVPTNFRALLKSAPISRTFGCERYADAVRRIKRAGSGLRNLLMTSSRNLGSFTPGPISALPSPTRGGRRMRESCTTALCGGAQ